MVNRKDFRPTNNSSIGISDKDRKTINDSRYGKQKVTIENGVTVTREKNGYVTQYQNVNAKSMNSVYIVQRGDYTGFTAVNDKNKVIARSKHAEQLGRKLSKKYRYVIFRD